MVLIPAARRRSRTARNRRGPAHSSAVIVGVLLAWCALGAPVRALDAQSVDGVRAVCGFAPAPPTLEYAVAAALVDGATGTVLYARNGSLPWAPASLTKLVTVYTALEAVAEGDFELSEARPVHPAAYPLRIAPGSSLMFLGPDQRVSGSDLLGGLLIASGNDAAVEVALRVSGGVAAFSNRMNAAVRADGFDFYFEEPAGLSPANRITAVDFAHFARLLIERWGPHVLPLTASETFAHPLPRHATSGERVTTIVQTNRNQLIGEYPGADGLKTGFIDESGYNLAATASRNGRRLIAVVLGVPGTSHAIGGERRARDAARLLDWGFEEFRTVSLGVPDVDAVRVWSGAQPTVVPRPEAVATVSVPVGVVEALSGRVETASEVWAPVAAGRELGSVIYTVDGCEVVRMALVAAEPIERGPLFTRLWGSLVRFWRRLTGVPAQANWSGDSR